MARWTGTDFVAKVRRGMGNPTDEEWTDAQLLILCDEASIEIAASEQPPELETADTLTTVSGTAEYEMAATDMLQIITLTDTSNEQALYRSDRREYETWTQGDYTSTTGDPQFWFVSGVGSNDRSQITFYPTPDGAYSVVVYYTKTPQQIVVSPTANTSEMRRQWDPLIAKLAAANGLSEDRQFSESGALRREAYGLWNKLKGTRARATETVTLLESPIAKHTRRDR